MNQTDCNDHNRFLRLAQLWLQLDDTIMGGQSSSQLEASSDGTVVWSGNLIVVCIHVMLNAYC